MFLVYTMYNYNHMKKVILLILLLCSQLSCIQTDPVVLSIEQQNTLMSYEQGNNNLPSTSMGINKENNDHYLQFQPEDIIRAYKQAYPDKIKEITYKNDDWAIKIYDLWYYWADGKLLPEELILKKENYDRYPFYRYSEELDPFAELSVERKNLLDKILENREKDPIERYPGFLNSLWRIYDRETSWAMVKTTWFLGYKLQIHRDLLEDLALVEEEIQRRMLVDSELSTFVQSLSRIDGYNWRKIAETDTLSVHSYGIALDLILKSYSQKEIYWLWAKNKGLDWYDVPYRNRFSPPEAFIEAFEKQGFVWGGKWLYFDTIHFEYKPEILFLNDMLLNK